MDRWWLAALTTLAVSLGSSPAQIPQKADITLFHGVRCLIQTEGPQWDRNTGTIVSGTIENLTDGPLELEAEPELLMISKASSKLSDRFWAPVDLLRDVPLGINKRPLDADRKAISIKSQPILLQFKSKGDVIHFRIDAQRLLWAKEISSIWPSATFFNTVKPDDYDLQLVLDTDKGRVETEKLSIHVGAQ